MIEVATAADAMALWEAWIELCARSRSKELNQSEREAFSSIEKLRASVGSYELRDVFITLAGTINTSWRTLSTDKQEKIREDLTAWDWEYLPHVLHKCALLPKELNEVTIQDISNINSTLVQQVLSEGL